MPTPALLVMPILTQSGFRIFDMPTKDKPLIPKQIIPVVLHPNTQHSGRLHEQTPEKNSSSNTISDSNDTKKAFCNICKEEKVKDDMWCVIDTVTNERYYECKAACQSLTPITVNIPFTQEETTQINTSLQEETTQINTSLDEVKEGILQRAFHWFFGDPSKQFQRMKIE